MAVEQVPHPDFLPSMTLAYWEHKVRLIDRLERIRPSSANTTALDCRSSDALFTPH